MIVKNETLMGTTLLCLGLCACGMELRKNGDVNAIHLTRVFAPVDRYDCEGELVSSRTEEVESPSAWVRIEADDDFAPLVHATVRNQSLRPDNNQGMLSYGRTSVSFQVHASNTWLAYQVKTGLNEFEYAFYEHVSTPGATLEPYETGKVVLDITYSERTDTEKRVLRPTVEECEVPEEESQEP
jgi:hypothetical protein